jgi:hypothetical protein
MIEQAVTYKFSKGIRRAKERYKTLPILLVVGLLAFLFLNPTIRDEKLVTKVSIGFITFVVLGLISYVTSKFAIRKLSELSIAMYPDRFERISRKQIESFLWKDMQRADILAYPNNEIATIKLTLANKQIVNLFGLEDMETAARQIEAALPDTASIHRKRMKLNWDHPIFMILAGILALALIIAIQEIGERAYRLFIVLFYFFFGLSILVSRPISRSQGNGLRLFETFFGILLMIGAVFILVLELLPN